MNVLHFNGKSVPVAKMETTMNVMLECIFVMEQYHASSKDFIFVDWNPNQQQQSGQQRPQLLPRCLQALPLPQQRLQLQQQRK